MNEAILLLAYGGPDSLDDLPAYLADIRGGRPTPPELLTEMRHRYALIGGRSPLLAITRRVADKLSDKTGRPAYVGMRHWQPRIAEAVAQMARDGVERFVAICMAPHASRMSTGAYRARLEEALAAAGDGMRADFVESWYREPAYLDGIAANVRAAMSRFGAEAGTGRGPMVVFTAHSLPASILAQGDPYDSQLAETARLVAGRVGLPDDRWTRCYQSAAKTGVPWLGPAIEEKVPELASAGERDIVVAPTGFIADHVEVLYDLDIGLQEIASRCGARVERTPMLNDSPALIDALADVALHPTPSGTTR
jgi:ferrochelatase